MNRAPSRCGALHPGRQVALFRNTAGWGSWVNWRGGGGSEHYQAFRRTAVLRFFFFFLPCSRVGRHIPLALLSSLFPAAGGFCQPLPHCPGFLCSPAPTMAFFLPLYIYVHFLPLCVLFVLFCCLLCFSFLLLQSWETQAESICSSSLWFKALSLNLSFPPPSTPFSPPHIHIHTVNMHIHAHSDNKPHRACGWS